MQAVTFPRLVGDIGGTNARFGWIESAQAPPTDIETLPCADYPSVVAAVRHYLAKTGKGQPVWCAIGIANPVVGDRVQMTNHHWSFSISEVKRELGLERFLLINDFTALALSLPGLAPTDLRQVGGGTAPGPGPESNARNIPAARAPGTDPVSQPLPGA